METILIPDVIIPARYLNVFDADKLAEHCMFDIDERFNEVVKPGDFIVGGENFRLWIIP